MMIPTIDPACVGFDVSIEDYLLLVSAAGFRAVEFSIESAKQVIHGQSLGALRALAQVRGVALSQFTCGTGVPSNLCVSAQEFERGVARWREHCALAEQIGCRRASVLVNSSKGNQHEAHGTPLTLEALQERLDMLRRVARQHGITLAVEFIDAELIAQAGTIIMGLGGDHLGLLLDTYGLHRVPDPVDYVARLPAGAIAWVHVADALGGVQLPGQLYRKPARTLPGAGALPLAAILEALQRHGYHGHLSVEVYGDVIMGPLSPGERAMRAADSLQSAELRRFVAWEG